MCNKFDKVIKNGKKRKKENAKWEKNIKVKKFKSTDPRPDCLNRINCLNENLKHC